MPVFRFFVLCAALLVLRPAHAETIETEHGSLLVEHLADLENPWAMVTLPDGRLLITEKPGRLRYYDNGVLSEPIDGIPKVVYQGNSGLLGLALDPDYARNRLIYFFYVQMAPDQPDDNKDKGDPRLNGIGAEGDGLKGGVVMRARLDGMHLSGHQVIWRQTPFEIGRGQFGGRLLFAPDKTLLITSGDRQYFDPAQDRGSNLGKIVRINRDGSIPKDNPFAGAKGMARQIWTIGHRNPLGIAFQPGTGALWAHEMGPQGGDELNLIRPAANYGWPTVSNGDNYDNSWIWPHWARADFTPPVASWAPSIAPSGMTFYQGDLLPGWKGDLLMGGLVSMSLWRLTLNGAEVVHQERIGMDERIRDVAVSPDGAVLLLTDGKDGALLRLSPAAETAQIGPK